MSRPTRREPPEGSLLITYTVTALIITATLFILYYLT